MDRRLKDTQNLYKAPEEIAVEWAKGQPSSIQRLNLLNGIKDWILAVLVNFTLWKQGMHGLNTQISQPFTFKKALSSGDECLWDMKQYIATMLPKIDSMHYFKRASHVVGFFKWVEQKSKGKHLWIFASTIKHISV